MAQTFSEYLEQIGEYGVVTQINHPIVTVEGLPFAKPQEIVIFESGELGEVFSLNKDNVEVLAFSQHPVKVKSKVTRTNSALSIAVGKELLGHIIDPLGEPITKSALFKRPKEQREVDIKPPGISSRERIKKPFRSGTTVVDMMVPLGKGQKELIAGDRKTGKSAFLLSSIKSQVQEGAIAVYAAIGKKKSDIKILEEFLVKEGIKDKVVIVATSSYDSPSLVYTTPYTAMTIAEYFRDEGTDVFLVLDDLSTHAKFYRELSLLAKRFPGRDSYPGDIFYTHARLLERAGNFVHTMKGEVSITCFPVAETIEGDFTGYVVTNLMGVTDGHLFFDSDAYYKGRRPAVNISLSVTRVGKQTQLKVKRHITRELTSFFSVYEKMQTYSHFGAELSDSVKGILKTGEKIYRFFNQPYNMIIPEEVQLILFTMLWYNLIEQDIEQWIDTYRANLTAACKNPKIQKMLSDIISQADTFNDLLTNVSTHKDEILALCKKNTV